MLTTRRIAQQSVHRLSSATTRTSTTSSTRRVPCSTKGKKSASSKAPKHVRNYQSSLKHPYYAATAAPLAQAGAQTSLARRAFDWYSKKLSTHPLLTKSITGGIIAAAGDIMCQAGLYYKKPKDDAATTYNKSFMASFCEAWDYRRSLHFFILGFTFVAPTSHYWYGGMAKHAWTRGQSFGQISKRVALDQFLWTPLFFVIWLGGFWSMEASSLNLPRVQEQLTSSLPNIMVANWILWIPAQYLNFYACPVKFQVLFVNLVELGWNCYLSFAASEGGVKEEEAAQDTIVEKNFVEDKEEQQQQQHRDTHRGAVVTV